MNAFFKAYCYLKEDPLLSNQPLECSEISIQASPEILRQIAIFMNECASKIEKPSHEGDAHFHLQDEWMEWSHSYPDVIVVSSPIEP